MKPKIIPLPNWLHNKCLLLNIFSVELHLACHNVIFGIDRYDKKSWTIFVTERGCGFKTEVEDDFVNWIKKSYQKMMDEHNDFNCKFSGIMIDYDIKNSTSHFQRYRVVSDVENVIYDSIATKLEVE